MVNTDFLRPYQNDAVNKMRDGCILNGDVGSGKSRTGLYYYFKEYGGYVGSGKIRPMTNPAPLYIITTAQKRDNGEWLGELANYGIGPCNSEIVIDSWNNIQKYDTVKNAFFMFDEDRVTGHGAWVKSFYKIAKNNRWIILSATPGDTWEQYIPVFIANGFYKNKTEFCREHVVYSRYCKYPKIDHYVNQGRLNAYRKEILIDMEFARQTVQHHEDIWCSFDKELYKYVNKNYWDPFKNEPLQQASSLCYVLRKVVNSSEDREKRLLEIHREHPRVIVFYNHDYERDKLLALCSANGILCAEWTGHRHELLPTTDNWMYLVNYGSGSEGWNCITTDTIVFYSQTYSYKTLHQAQGRIDRMNTPYKDLYYYHFKSKSGIDVAISKALSSKKSFNESKYVEKINDKTEKQSIDQPGARFR